MVSAHPFAAEKPYENLCKMFDGLGQVGKVDYGYCCQVFGQCLEGSDDLLSSSKSVGAYDFTIRWVGRMHEEETLFPGQLQNEEFYHLDEQADELISKLIVKLKKEKEGLTRFLGEKLLEEMSKSILSLFSVMAEERIKVVREHAEPNAEAQMEKEGLKKGAMALGLQYDSDSDYQYGRWDLYKWWLAWRDVDQLAKVSALRMTVTLFTTGGTRSAKHVVTKQSKDLLACIALLFLACELLSQYKKRDQNSIFGRTNSYIHDGQIW